MLGDPGRRIELDRADVAGALLRARNTTLIGGRGNDKLLEDNNPDGSTTLLRTRLFKACERISLEDFHKLDFASLLN